MYSSIPVGLDIGILTMSLGYRVFFVHGTDVRRISHKRYNSLYSNSVESFTSYGGQTVISVLVFYELVARKPDCIVRMDTQKIRFDENGFLDGAYEDEGLQLAASKMDDLLSGIVTSKETARSDDSGQVNGAIVDASKRFDERRWNQRHPELSGPIVKKILTGVFGSAGLK